MSFYRETVIKAVRKPRYCAGCGAIINAGERALDCSGKHNGDFWSAIYHQECRVAECALNDLRDYRWNDEWAALSGIEWEDWPWLIEEHPAVAKRRKITAERYQKVADEQERCRLAFARVKP